MRKVCVVLLLCSMLCCILGGCGFRYEPDTLKPQKRVEGVVLDVRNKSYSEVVQPPLTAGVAYREKEGGHIRHFDTRNWCGDHKLEIAYLYRSDVVTGQREPVMTLSLKGASYRGLPASLDVNGDGVINGLDDQNGDGFVKVGETGNYSILLDDNGDGRHDAADAVYLQEFLRRLKLERPGRFVFTLLDTSSFRLTPGLVWAVLQTYPGTEIKDLLCLDANQNLALNWIDDLNLDGRLTSEDTALMLQFWKSYVAKYGESATVEHFCTVPAQLFERVKDIRLPSFWMANRVSFKITQGRLGDDDSRMAVRKKFLREEVDTEGEYDAGQGAAIGAGLGGAVGAGLGIWGILEMGWNPVAGALTFLGGAAGGGALGALGSLLCGALIETRYYQYTMENNNAVVQIVRFFTGNGRVVSFLDTPTSFSVWEESERYVNGKKFSKQITSPPQEIEGWISDLSPDSVPYRVVVDDSSASLVRKIVFGIDGNGQLQFRAWKKNNVWLIIAEDDGYVQNQCIKLVQGLMQNPFVLGQIAETVRETRSGGFYWGKAENFENYVCSLFRRPYGRDERQKF